MEDLLQGDPKFMDDGRVLLPALLTSMPDMPVPRESIQVEAGKGAKGIVSIHLHVLIVTTIDFTSKEDVKRVWTPKECGEGGMRVPVEGVSEGAALSFTSGSISSLET